MMSRVVGFLGKGPARHAILLSVVLALFAASVIFHLRASGTIPGREDIYVSWEASVDLAKGLNPYDDVVAADRRSHPTYLPAFYLLCAALYRLGVTDFRDFLLYWRPVVEASHFLIGLLLLYAGVRRGSLAFGCFAAGFWYFNRWTLAVVNIVHLDTPSLLLFLLSMELFERRRAASLLLFGGSLVVKQMAIFIVPLYLIWVYRQDGPETSARRTAKALILIVVIPLLFSLPFLVWGPACFLKSILWSATREPFSDFAVKSLDAALGLVGLPAKVPMLGLMALIYGTALLGRLGRYAAALLTMAVFLDFNSVLLFQYMVWTVPLLPMAALETRCSQPGGSGSLPISTSEPVGAAG